jgi:hypothetical protein
MAGRNFSRVQGLEKEIKLLAGSITLNASGAASSNIMGVASVEQSETGELILTLEDGYPELLFTNIHVGGVTYELTGDTDIELKTIVVENVDSATPVSGATGEAFLVLKNSTVS